MRYEDLVAALSQEVPELDVAEPDLVPVTLGALVALLGDVWRESGPASDIAARILAFIERAARFGDPEVRDQLKVSFLEDLGSLGPDCGKVLGHLGPASQELRAEYEQQWGPICRIAAS